MSKAKPHNRRKMQGILLLMLSGAILFAWFVEKTKRVSRQINLAKPVNLVISPGKISFKIPENWKEDTIDYENSYVISKWQIVIKKETIAQCILFELPPIHTIPELKPLSAIDAIFPGKSSLKIIDIGKVTQLSRKLAEQSTKAITLIDGQTYTLNIETIHFPDNSSICFVVISNPQYDGFIEKTIEKIKDSIKYETSSRIKYIKAKEKIKIGPLQITLPEDFWITEDRNFPIVNFRSVPYGHETTLQGRIKLVYLLESQDPKELVANYFKSYYEPEKTIEVYKEDKTNTFSVLKAVDNIAIIVGKEKQHWEDTLWLAISNKKNGKGRYGILINILTKDNGRDEGRYKASSIVESILRNVKYNEDQLPLLSLSSLMQDKNFMSIAITGPNWFETKVLGKSEGLSADLTTVRKEGLLSAEYIHGKRSSLEYTKYEYATTAPDSSCNYQTVIILKISSQNKVRILEIKGRAKSSPDGSVELYIKNNGDNYFKNIVTEGYIPPTLIDTAISYIARKGKTGEVFIITTPQELSADLESAFIKKISDRKVAIIFGSEFEYGIYRFDEKFNIEGIEIMPGAESLRRSMEEIARKYPQDVRQAINFFGKLIE